MKNRTARIRFALTALLLAMLAVSCNFRELMDPEQPVLYVKVNIPDAVLTKAEIGTVDPWAAERSVSSLQIWVFRAGSIENSGLIGYKTLDPDALAATGLRNGSPARFSISVSQTIMEQKPNVDVYAVINGESAGFTIDKFPSASGDWAKLAPTDLQAFVLGADCFGVSTLVSEVPAAGLPMAGVMKNEPMTGQYPVLTISTLTLTRAVSKLRFVFCQMTENGTPVDNFNITSININGQIGENEKFITDQTYGSNTYLTRLFDSTGYVLLDKTWTSNLPAPANNPAPGDYLYDGAMSAQEFEDLIDGGVRSGVLTQWGLTYLRETDKQLSGTIKYTVGSGPEKTAIFTMARQGDFTRNHSWIIYGYFIGGRLVVQPTVLPWIAGQDRISYKTTGFTEFKYEKPWLRYDVDKKSSTWDDTWLVVAYGYEGGNVGKPTHSPMFTLETISADNLRLQINNDHFIIVQMTETTDALGYPVFTYTKHAQTLDIPASHEKTTTNFYVVPVSDAVMADPYVKVFLTRLSSSGQPPVNIPFNHNLPGDEDHTSILIYNPGMAEYTANMENHKSSGDVQPSEYWLEEEG
ncbi:MAG: hypothetical protein J6W82_02845 [Bacteroidales bacterium]|nr:hypothetical protein [Bacteroidales bacterium]